MPVIQKTQAIPKGVASSFHAPKKTFRTAEMPFHTITLKPPNYD